MPDEIMLQEALPEMLSIQLLAADVYVIFLGCAQGEEQRLWQKMLTEELSHIRFIAMLMEAETVPKVLMPSVKMDAFRQLYGRAQETAPRSAFDRMLWALRLEHAEIDFGVEALAAKRMEDAPDTPVYPGPIQDHYLGLLKWAERYQGAREIALQVARIREHIPRTDETCTFRKLE